MPPKPRGGGSKPRKKAASGGEVGEEKTGKVEQAAQGTCMSVELPLTANPVHGDPCPLATSKSSRQAAAQDPFASLVPGWNTTIPTRARTSPSPPVNPTSAKSPSTGVHSKNPFAQLSGLDFSRLDSRPPTQGKPPTLPLPLIAIPAGSSLPQDPFAGLEASNLPPIVKDSGRILHSPLSGGIPQALVPKNSGGLTIPPPAKSRQIPLVLPTAKKTGAPTPSNSGGLSNPPLAKTRQSPLDGLAPPALPQKDLASSPSSNTSTLGQKRKHSRVENEADHDSTTRASVQPEVARTEQRIRPPGPLKRSKVSTVSSVIDF